MRAIITIGMMIISCFILTGCTPKTKTKTPAQKEDIYVSTEMKASEVETEKVSKVSYPISQSVVIETFKIAKITNKPDTDFISGACYILFVPDDARKLARIFDEYRFLSITDDDYYELKENGYTSLTLEQIKTLKEHYNDYLNRKKEAKHEEENRERSASEIYGN